MSPLGAGALALLVAAAAAFGCASSANGVNGSASGGASSGGGASGGTAGIGHGGSAGSASGAGSGGAHNQGTGGIGEMCLICGGAGSGGAPSGGAGGALPFPCFGGNGALMAAAKACETDADCEALPTSNCCGPGEIVGIATRARDYEACYPYPSDCPAGLGCASFPSTEDGMQPGYPPNSFKLSCVAVDGGPKSCRTLSRDASEGTLWSCRCSTGASCCEPASVP